MMLPLIRREYNTLSHRWDAQGRAVIKIIRFPFCPEVDRKNGTWGTGSQNTDSFTHPILNNSAEVRAFPERGR
jgi:hypothetical protein